MMDTARVIQVIETTLLRRGKGVDGDPVRIITQYWSTDGELLAEVDPYVENPGMSVEEFIASEQKRKQDVEDFRMQRGRYAP